MKYYVYTLNNAGGVPFYVGKGSGRRMYIHEWNVKNGNLPNGSNKHLFNKINNLDKIEYRIEFESDNEQECYDKEIQLIKKYGIENLCNLTHGGDGVRATDEIKRKISKKITGLKHTIKTKNKISKYNLNRFKNVEERLKISVATKKALQNPEIRKKMSDAKKGKSPHNKGKDSRILHICINCNNEYRNYSKTSKYCSMKCRNEYISNIDLIVSNCKICSVEFKHKSYRHRVFCSNDCQRNWLYEQRTKS